jgi:hypothetical protein
LRKKREIKWERMVLNIQGLNIEFLKC